MVQYGIATSDEDLRQILALQHKNLPVNISEEEAQTQGFVTVHHEFDLLKRMNEPYPHIVAKHGERVVGYTLVMLRSFQNDIPVLVPMFKEIDAIVHEGQLLGTCKYFIMGQVCIDKDYRGQGIFTGLYREMQRRMNPYFDYIITEVDKSNTRSMRAHEKVGFKNVHEYRSGKDWAILLLPTMQAEFHEAKPV